MKVKFLTQEWGLKVHQWMKEHLQVYEPPSKNRFAPNYYNSGGKGSGGHCIWYTKVHAGVFCALAPKLIRYGREDRYKSINWSTTSLIV